MDKKIALGAAIARQPAPSNNVPLATQSGPSRIVSISNSGFSRSTLETSGFVSQIPQHDALGPACATSASDTMTFTVEATIDNAASIHAHEISHELRAPIDEPEDAQPKHEESSPLAKVDVQARVPQWDREVRKISRQLQNIAVDSDPEAALQRLEKLNTKNSLGEFALGQQLQNMMDSASSQSRASRVELNVIYLKIVHALAHAAGEKGTTPAARLLRSPDADRSWLARGMFVMRPGYYRSVLKHGQDFPDLTRTLKSLVDSLASQSGQTAVPKQVAEVQRALKERHAFQDITEWPTPEFTEIWQMLKPHNPALADAQARWQTGHQ